MTKSRCECCSHDSVARSTKNAQFIAAGKVYSSFAMPNPISMTPEDLARELIDAKFQASGWIVQTYREMNLGAGRGLAVTEFPGAHGEADYLLYADGKALGVVEAKPVGHTLKGVEGQSASYADGLPIKLPTWLRPLPFLYESTGEVTQFTIWMELHARSRDIFQFHRPETLLELIKQEAPLRGLLRQMPAPSPDGLWPKQHTAIINLEQSLALGKPKALISLHAWRTEKVVS